MKKSLIGLMAAGLLVGPALGAVASAATDQASVRAADAAASVLPIPPPKFHGVITKTYETSKPDFPQPIKAPEHAPNVLLIMLDDVGFSASSTFGGMIQTPALDKLATNGLRYNDFNTTALCSPTRAALLTGRNHHQVGFGVISEVATGFPGYDSLWGPNAASIATILRDHGYSTAAFGKWHNAPPWQAGPTGPFTQWPTGKGFQYFYGFVGAESSEYRPQLYMDTIPVEPSKTPAQGYYLTTDLADHAISWVQTHDSVDPGKPWFIYWAPGATHAPIQAPANWIAKYKGKFTGGWNEYRKTVFAQQKKLGVIPADAKLTPWPSFLPKWDSLSPDARKVYTRQMQVYAAYLSVTDHEVGRIIKKVRALPGGNNTLIFYLAGDNGASAEGGMTGTLNNMKTLLGFQGSVKNQLAHLTQWGGPQFEPHYAVPWAWAMSTPFKWTKQVASDLGGVRNGMVVSWPDRIKHPGGLRTQFIHVTDIAPTIYQATGITMPTEVNGVKQIPLAGKSLLYTLNDPKASTEHQVQYFEMRANRAIYSHGWWAAARHGVPWKLVGSNGDFKDDKWRLYNLNKDFSEDVDLASKDPEKLKQMRALFDREASANNVYPLDSRAFQRVDPLTFPSPLRGRTDFSYAPGTVRIPESDAPSVQGHSHRISTWIDVTKGGVEGVIAAEGGESGGWTLYVKDNHLVYENNFFDHHDVLRSKDPLPQGRVNIEFDYQQTKKAWGSGGPATLMINGRIVASDTFAHVVPSIYSFTETLDIGEDTGTTVSHAYASPYKFTGVMGSVKIKLL